MNLIIINEGIIKNKKEINEPQKEQINSDKSGQYSLVIN